MVGAWLYDWIYRFGAPWETGPRSELVGLVEQGRLSPSQLPRAVDLGCGSGANACLLASRGFDVVGVDFSTVALRKAEAKARAQGVADRVRFVRGDLTADAIPGVGGPFDLLVDYGALDDLSREKRPRMAALAASLSRPGSRFLLWCFYSDRASLPRFSFKGPSRAIGAMERGEERTLFARDWDIERLPEPAEGSGAACFLMVKR